MFRNIMLPLDGSHFSELALPLAIRVAQTSGGRLHIVRVHAAAAAAGETVISTNYDELVRDWERDALDAACARARDARVDTCAELLEPPVVAGLQRYITAVGIDLVIMTTHGRSGIKRAVMGSTAEQCVRKTQVPVLLLRPRSEADEVRTHLGDVQRILVTLDGSVESESVLPHAIMLAQLAGAEILLTRIAAAPFDVAITISTDALREYVERLRVQGEEYLQKIADKMPGGMRVRCLALASERAIDGILQCALDQNADMIAMATHGRSGWTRVAVGSVAESVLHRSTTPVLLIRGTTEPASAVLYSERSEPAHSGD